MENIINDKEKQVMAKSKDRDKIMGGFVWKFAERMSSQGIAFVISIILARLLMPEQYGIIAMIQVFIAIANVFVTGGFTASLIQKKDADELDFTTIFYCTLTMSILMYGLLYVGAPYIAEFYNMPDLCIVTRVFGLTLIVTSYQTVQQAYVSRHMMFKKNFYATSIATLLSGIIGIAMAYMGFGVWALVGQTLASIIFNMFTLMMIVPWKPKLMFSWERARSLMGYGSKLLASDLVNTVYKEFNQLIVGKFYAAADLALYNRGRHLPHLVTVNMDTTIRSVLFPAMSNYSDNPARIKNMLRRGIKTGSYITFFCLTLLTVCSKPIVLILLTEKWADCIPYMQIYCVTQMFMMMSGYNLQALKALGKSEEVLKLEVFKKPIFIIVILVAAYISVMAVVYATLINAIYALILNLSPTRKLLDYSFSQQICDLIPATLLCAVVACFTLPISYLNWNVYIILFSQILVGFMIFILLSRIFKVNSYIYVNDMLKDVLNKKFKKKTKK